MDWIANLPLTLSAEVIRSKTESELYGWENFGLLFLLTQSLTNYGHSLECDHSKKA